MCGLRQGGHSYFALDITNPDAPQHLFTFGHDPLNDEVSYWAADGTRTNYDTTGVVPDEYNFANLGESWSTPVIMNLNDGGIETWVAVFAGGYNGAVNPNYGSSVFVVNLEDGGKIIDK